MGNCLDRAMSDDAEDEIIESNDSSQEQRSRSQSRTSNRNHHHYYGRSQDNYIRLTGSSSSIASSLVSLTMSGNQRTFNISNSQNINRHSNNNRQFNQDQFSNNVLFGSSVGSPSNAYLSSLQSSSLQIGSIPSSIQPHNSSFNSQQVFYLTPNQQRTADQLTEEEQIKLLKRMALIQQLPSGSFDETKKNKECVICMIDFEVNDTIKYLPCMHTFHQSCIDAWLVRSLICPSCMEPVDAGLLTAYENE